MLIVIKIKTHGFESVCSRDVENTVIFSLRNKSSESQDSVTLNHSAETTKDIPVEH